MKPSMCPIKYCAVVLFSVISLPAFSQLTGNVGIGTTTPQTKLEVKNPVNSAIKIRSNNYLDTARLILSNRNTSEQGTDFIFSSNRETGLNILTTSDVPANNNASILFLSPQGSVGIGTLTPAFALDVADRIRLRSGVSGTAGIWLNKTDNSSPAGFIGNYDDTHIGMYGNNGAAWAFLMNTTNGNVGIGTATPLQKIDVNGRMNITDGVIQRGGAAITATSDLGLYSRISGNYIRLVTNAAPIRFFSDDNVGTNANMTIEANGNVGIGTSSPQAQLDVSGFTKLGTDAPKIKMKKLTGTTSPTDGGSVHITHGLNEAKIIAVDVMVEFIPTGYIHQAYRRNAGYEFNFMVGDEGIYIDNIAFNSGSILSKPVRILITYEE